MENRDKMLARACVGTALDDLWDVYRQIREAYEYIPDEGLHKMSCQILTDMIDMLIIERRLNNDEV